MIKIGLFSKKIILINKYLTYLRNGWVTIRKNPFIQTDYNRGQAITLMVIEIVIILIMLGLLVYWHIKNPDSKAVTLNY